MKTRVENFLEQLRCPICHSTCAWEPTEVKCHGPQCQARFPIVQGIPVLIDESRSLFTIPEVVKQMAGPGMASKVPLRRRLENKLVPPITKNFVAAGNLKIFFERILADNSKPLILIIGGSTVGQGLEGFLKHPDIRFIESDIYLGPRTNLINDAQALPVADCSVDGVLIQAVTEYLVHPQRAIEEIHRVLKPDGLVYCETPFFFPGHGGRYDLHRFSHVGHRLLFRDFTEVSSGPVSGPGTALAVAYKYFLMTFFSGRWGRIFAHLFAHYTAFWLKHVDGILLHKAGTYDCATGYYFLGKKADSRQTDHALSLTYRGLYQLR